MTKRAVEVQDKTCWTTASISAVVGEKAKDGPVGIDRSEGHIAAAQGGGALFWSCMNFCNLWQIEISWPFAQQNSQRVPFDDCEKGRLEVNCGGAMIATMGSYGGREGVANTWLEDDIW